MPKPAATHLRTTIRLRGDLLNAAKRKAAERGISLTQFIEDAVRLETLKPAAKAPEQRFVLPISTATGGAAPGVDLTNLRQVIADLDLEHDLRIARGE